MRVPTDLRESLAKCVSQHGTAACAYKNNAAAAAPIPANAGTIVLIGAAAPEKDELETEADAALGATEPVLAASPEPDTGPDAGLAEPDGADEAPLTVDEAPALSFSVPAVMVKGKLLMKYCESPLKVKVSTVVASLYSVQNSSDSTDDPGTAVSIAAQS